MRRLKLQRYCPLLTLLGLLLSASLPAQENPWVELQTSRGNMIIELFADKAPVTVDNFIQYINEGFYDGTIIHRARYDWVIQGGGYDRFYQSKETRGPIRNEANNGLQNTTATIAMARHSDPDSADSQFFINLDDNHSLDYKDETDEGWGYCVFGQVIKGLEIASEISQMEKQEVEHIGPTVPIGPIVIEKMIILDE